MPARSIDGFEIVRELGRGGMGVVYEARHPSLPRSVALKLILESAADGDALARFGREAELLARVNHANVLKIHKLGRAAEGPYLVTELLEGQDLKELTRQGALPAEQAATILASLAKGLVAVHAEGVLHRDLKPQNVFVRTDGTPVLLDFGLARDVGAEKLTQTGMVVGTPAYMAPEQAGEGSTDQLDVRSDVYGLGAVLYRTLSGRAPFQGSVVSILKQVLFDDPRWPSADEPSTPRDLEAICRQAMAKDPSKRYPGAQALADDLDRFLAGKSVQASPPAPIRRRGPILLAGVAVLGVALALAAVFWEAVDPPSGEPGGDGVAVVVSLKNGRGEATSVRSRRTKWVAEPKEFGKPPAVAANGRGPGGCMVRFVAPAGPGRPLRVVMVSEHSQVFSCFELGPDEDPSQVVKVFASEFSWPGTHDGGGVRALAVDPGGRFAVFSGNSGSIWKVALDGKPGDVPEALAWRALDDAFAIGALAVSGDGKAVFAGYEAYEGGSQVTDEGGSHETDKGESHVCRVDVESRDVVSARLGRKRIKALGLFEEDRVLVAVEIETDGEASNQFFARFWNAKTLEPRGVKAELHDGATAVATFFDKQDFVFALGSRSHGLTIYEAPKAASRFFETSRYCVGVGTKAQQVAESLRVGGFERAGSIAAAAHSAPARRMAFSPSGARLLSSAGLRKTEKGDQVGFGDLAIFDVRSGAEVERYSFPVRAEGKAKDPWFVDLTVDGNGEPLIVVGLINGGARLLRPPTGSLDPPPEIPSGEGALLSKLNEGQSGKHRVEFVPGPARDGSPHALTFSVGESRLTLWGLGDPARPAEVESWTLNDKFWDGVLAVAPNGRFALAGGTGAVLLRVDLSSGAAPHGIEIRRRGTAPLDKVERLLISQDSQFAYLAGPRKGNPVVVRVDLRTDARKVVTHVAPQEGYQVRGMIFAQGGEHLLTGDNESGRTGASRFRVLRSDTLAPVADRGRQFVRTNDGVTAMAAGPSGGLAVGARQHGLRYFRIEDSSKISATRWEANPRGSRRHVRLRRDDSDTVSRNYSPPAAHAPIRDLAFARGGTLLVAVSGDDSKDDQGDHGDVRIFDAHTGRLLTRYRGSDSFPGEPRETGLDFETLAVSPAGELILAGQRDGSVLVLRPPSAVLER